MIFLEDVLLTVLCRSHKRRDKLYGTIKGLCGANNDIKDRYDHLLPLVKQHWKDDRVMICSRGTRQVNERKAKALREVKAILVALNKR